MRVRKKIASKGSGTIRTCAFMRVGVALLKEVHHCGVAFEVSVWSEASPQLPSTLLYKKFGIFSWGLHPSS